MSRRDGVRRLWRVLHRYRGWMALGTLLALLGVLAGIGLLAVAGWFIASMALAGAAGAALNYFTPAALIRGFAIVRTGGRYLERLLTHDATLRALSGLRLWLYDRLLPLAPARTGFLGDIELFSRLRADVDRLEHAFLGVGVPIAVALVVVPMVLVLQAVWLWPLALLTLLAVVAVAWLLPWWLLGRGAEPAAAQVADEAALRAVVADSVRGAPELALYGADAERVRQAGALTERQQVHRRRIDRLQGWGGALVPLAAQLIAAVSLLLALWARHARGLPGADVAMLVLLALGVFEVLATLPEALAQLGATRAAAARVFELADAEPALTDPNTPHAPPRRFDLRLRDVVLRYPGTAEPALRGVDLDLPAGARLAISGPSGAGKSSLVQALLCLQPLAGGCIELGGVPLHAYAGDDVRGAIAVVEQRTHIFHASLRDNLLVARADADESALQAALRGAQLEAFVAALPHGLDTWLGEAGVNLSGGEARRVAIARALLADRPILILDEPTEGLDSATAQSLLTALEELTRGRTVLLISHRLGGLARLVDRVAMMEAGRLQSRQAPHTE